MVDVGVHTGAFDSTRRRSAGREAEGEAEETNLVPSRSDLQVCVSFAGRRLLYMTLVADRETPVPLPSQHRSQPKVQHIYLLPGRFIRTV